MERKAPIENSRILEVFSIAFTILSILCIIGCDEDLFTDSEERPDQIQYLSPQHSLAWSPDSSMLAYIFDNLLVVKDTVTGEIRQLTGTGFYDEPTWSPDSVRIAYSSASYGVRADIYVRKADRSDVPKRLTKDKASDLHPRWSPDGAKIAFHAFRKKSMDIWIRNADGSGEGNG